MGTGNKVEDYGVGFYTKYGDGGVDIAPIADLYKSEVWQLGVELGVNPRIVSKHLLLMDCGMMVEPTKINSVSTYEDLEWVMESKIFEHCEDPTEVTQWVGKELTLEQKEMPLSNTRSSILKTNIRWNLFLHLNYENWSYRGRADWVSAFAPFFVNKAGYDVLVSDIREDYVNDLNQKKITTNEPEVEDLLRVSKNFRSPPLITKKSLMSVISSTPLSRHLQMTMGLMMCLLYGMLSKTSRM